MNVPELGGHKGFINKATSSNELSSINEAAVGWMLYEQMWARSRIWSLKFQSWGIELLKQKGLSNPKEKALRLKGPKDWVPEG